ncbi:MAG: hypothetical protein ACFFEK_06920 [Candidatus Thorarchaeota archaeon]
MSEKISGKIISANIGEFSKRRIRYGYIGLELADKTHMKIKVDSYTLYETLEIGDEVVVEFENLASTDIHVARKIQLISNVEHPSDEISATV